MDERDHKAMNKELNHPSCLGAVISRLEQAEIVAKAVIKFGDLNKVSKWCGVPVWLLQNVLQGNEIRQTQYGKMVWMRDRLNGL